MQPLMYTEIAAWFHLLTAPEDYAEEAAVYREVIHRFARRPKPCSNWAAAAAIMLPISNSTSILPWSISHRKCCA